MPPGSRHAPPRPSSPPRSPAPDWPCEAANRAKIAGSCAEVRVARRLRSTCMCECVCANQRQPTPAKSRTAPSGALGSAPRCSPRQLPGPATGEQTGRVGLMVERMCGGERRCQPVPTGANQRQPTQIKMLSNTNQTFNRRQPKRQPTPFHLPVDEGIHGLFRLAVRHCGHLFEGADRRW